MSPGYGDLNRAARRYRTHKQAAERARGALIAEVLDAIERGMSEAEAARRADVARMTVRAWRKGAK